MSRCPDNAAERDPHRKGRITRESAGQTRTEAPWSEREPPGFRVSCSNGHRCSSLLNASFESALGDKVFRIMPAWGHTLLIQILTERSDFYLIQSYFSFEAGLQIFTYILKCLNMLNVSGINSPKLGEFKTAADDNDDGFTKLEENGCFLLAPTFHGGQARL